MGDQKTCFVVMGFGEKTDLATGRLLDLDKSYRIIIKKAVEDAGLKCVRADDVIHSGQIDKPMYQLLLDADVVIADLSTANLNAIYELGVRHALRPHTTIVIAENQFKFPFDLSHVSITPYEHLGKGIDAEEAENVREKLKMMIHTLLDQPAIDSPVFDFLPQWRPWDAPAAAPAAQPFAAAEATGHLSAAAPADAPPQPAEEATASALLEMFRTAKDSGNWGMAAMCLQSLRQRRPNDEYLRQQLALATYKSAQPDPVSALLAAKAILQELNPQSSLDPETLGLWAAVHKYLYERTNEPAHLDEAIWALQKGFYLKNDYYNGINLAFVLDVRASISAPRDATADRVFAERIRRRVIAICRQLLAEGVKDKDEEFWVQASLVEALLGSGQPTEAAELKAAITQHPPKPWMTDTMEKQLAKLTALQA